MFSLARVYGIEVRTILDVNCKKSYDLSTNETIYLPAERVDVETVVPELKHPLYGLAYKNPIQFMWEGQLQEGESYRLEVIHVDKGVVYQTHTLDMTVQTSIPDESFGELHWIVTVVQAGQEVARSAEGMFWFDPYLGRHSQSPVATPTPSN